MNTVDMPDNQVENLVMLVRKTRIISGRRDARVNLSNSPTKKWRQSRPSFEKLSRALLTEAHKKA
jgi:hypothetical protein